MVMIIIVVAILLLGVTSVALYLHKLAMKNESKDYLKRDKALNITYTPEKYREVVANQNWWEAQVPEDLWRRSTDDLALHASFIAAKEQSKLFVLLAHGYTSKGKDMAYFAKYYSESFDANVLAPDARGHGKSAGDYFGMGWLDRLDYLGWIEYLIQTYGEDIQIILHGQSMGAASLMMMVGEPLPKQVKFLVEDCGYTGVYELFGYQLWRKYKIPGFLLLPFANIVTRIKNGFSLKEASSVRQLKKTQLPIIFVHGAEDTFVPTEMMQKLYAAVQGAKIAIVIEGAGHGEAFDYDKEDKIKKAISVFYSKYC